MTASEVIDRRRRFTEAVLSSASAGIIGVDASGSIGILNRSAEKLIGHAKSETLGHPLSEIIPELDDMMRTAREGTQRLVQGQITITRDGRERNLSVRADAERTSQSQDSYIITLDDITDLVSAQRTSAWGDVARRIAHEIKNPLTPIQLSAERLNANSARSDRDKAIFDQCTDTIVRQVDDIKRMVDEFSRFARMPKPVLESEDLAESVRQVVFLIRVGHSDFVWRPRSRKSRSGPHSTGGYFASVYQHRQERNRSHRRVPPATPAKGRIVVVAAPGDDIIIDVIDNGVGLPKVTARGCSNPTSPPAKKEPASGSRSSLNSRRSWRRPRPPRRSGDPSRLPGSLDAAALCHVRSRAQCRRQAERRSDAIDA